MVTRETLNARLAVLEAEFKKAEAAVEQMRAQAQTIYGAILLVKELLAEPEDAPAQKDDTSAEHRA